jgi:hypothetical protein
MLALSELVQGTKYMVHCHNYAYEDLMHNNPGKRVCKTFLGLTTQYSEDAQPEFSAGIYGGTTISNPKYIQIYPASIPYKQELMQRSVLRERRVIHSILMENTLLPHDLQREILSYLFPVKGYREKNGISRVILSV